jgi:hypothetical protein
MSPDFVADTLTPLVLLIWLGGFALLLVFGYLGPHLAYSHYLLRRAATLDRSQLAGTGLLRRYERGFREEQTDPEMERLRRKVWRRITYVIVWTLTLPVIAGVLFALISTSSPSH